MKCLMTGQDEEEREKEKGRKRGKIDRMIREDKYRRYRIVEIWLATQKSVHEVGLLVPRPSKVCVGRNAGWTWTLRLPVTIRPKAFERRRRVLPSWIVASLSNPSLKNLKYRFDGGWWVGWPKTQTPRGWTGGCRHAASTYICRIQPFNTRKNSRMIRKNIHLTLQFFCVGVYASWMWICK